MSDYNDFNVFENYLNSRLEENSPHNQTIKNKLFELVGDYSNKRILDIGCGVGSFCKDFSDKAKNIIGIDISSKVIEYALKNNNASNIKYIQGDIARLDEIDTTFDIVFSDMVFNYIKDYEKLMKDIYKCLDKNGIVVFSQVHPISTASIGESDWVEENGKLKFKLDNYSNVSKRSREYFGGTFELYHRRFEDLINIAIKNGFTLDALYEPYITEKEYNRPSFLIIKLLKL